MRPTGKDPDRARRMKKLDLLRVLREGGKYGRVSRAIGLSESRWGELEDRVMRRYSPGDLLNRYGIGVDSLLGAIMLGRCYTDAVSLVFLSRGIRYVSREEFVAMFCLVRAAEEGARATEEALLELSWGGAEDRNARDGDAGGLMYG